MSAPPNGPWPGAWDYRKLVRKPGEVFRDPWLQTTTANPIDPQCGLPFGLAGGLGTVFHMTDGLRSQAVKLFFGEVPERQHRYQAIFNHCRALGLGCLVDFQYDPEGFHHNNRYFPVQTMTWVEAPKLDVWVREQVQAGAHDRLRTLADRWVELVAELKRHHIAHGDLQHGNVLVCADGSLRLVDYDGMCVPALVDRDPEEVGFPGYQHPHRSTQKLHLELDNFAAWVILIALRAVAAQPELWQIFVENIDNENLLFTESDYLQPENSTLWPVLLASPDTEVRAWAGNLRACLAGSFDDIPPFDPYPWVPLEQPGALDPALDEPDIAPEDDFELPPFEIYPAVPLEQSVALDEPVLNPDDDFTLVLDEDEDQKREESRKQAESAVQNRSLCQLAQVDPNLLDLWPELRNQVNTARRLLPNLEELQRTQANDKDGEQLIELWTRQAPVLQPYLGWVEVAQLHGAVQAAHQQREQRRVCARLLAAVKADDVHGLAAAWQELVRLGGQDAVREHRERAERAVEQSALLLTLEKIPLEFGEVNDSAFFDAWQGSLLNSKMLPGKAGNQARARFQSVGQRVAHLKVLRNLLAQAVTPDSDEQVSQKAALFPAQYVWLPATAHQLAEAQRRAAARNDALKKLHELAKGGGSVVHLERVKQLLTREVYAGFVHYPPWNVTRRKGHHQPLVSPGTFDRVLDRLKKNARLQQRKDINDDFPLRGFLTCGVCFRPFTGGWTKGRNRAFPYYRCKTVGCTLQNKSIRADRIHEEFEALLLGRLKPRANIMEIVRKELMSQWQTKKMDVETLRKERQAKLDTIQKEIEKYLEAIRLCQNPQVINSTVSFA